MTETFDELFELITPHNAQAEQAAIGSMLIDPACINDVLSKTKPSDFYLETNRSIYETISAMNLSGSTVDPVTVLGQMRSNGTLRDNTQKYILELMQVNIPQGGGYRRKRISILIKIKRASGISMCYSLFLIVYCSHFNRNQ